MQSPGEHGRNYAVTWQTRVELRGHRGNTGGTTRSPGEHGWNYAVTWRTRAELHDHLANYAVAWGTYYKGRTRVTPRGVDVRVTGDASDVLYAPRLRGHLVDESCDHDGPAAQRVREEELGETERVRAASVYLRRRTQ